MAQVHFTLNLRRHVECPLADVPGNTVKEVFDAVFVANPKVKDYIVDERGALRKHMAAFVDGQAVIDRQGLTDPVGPLSEVYVIQALSGG